MCYDHLIYLYADNKVQVQVPVQVHLHVLLHVLINFIFLDKRACITVARSIEKIESWWLRFRKTAKPKTSEVYSTFIYILISLLYYYGVLFRQQLVIVF